MEQRSWEVLMGIKVKNEITSPQFLVVEAKHGNGAWLKAKREMRKLFPDTHDRDFMLVMLRPVVDRFKEYTFKQVMMIFKDGLKTMKRLGMKSDNQ